VQASATARELLKCLEIDARCCGWSATQPRAGTY
jgi:hypothetical protein